MTSELDEYLIPRPEDVAVGVVQTLEPKIHRVTFVAASKFSRSPASTVSIYLDEKYYTLSGDPYYRAITRDKAVLSAARVRFERVLQANGWDVVVELKGTLWPRTPRFDVKPKPIRYMHDDR